jgi:hypothetical protein
MFLLAKNCQIIFATFKRHFRIGSSTTNNPNRIGDILLYILLNYKWYFIQFKIVFGYEKLKGMLVTRILQKTYYTLKSLTETFCICNKFYMKNSMCLLCELRWCSPVKHFALSRRRSRVQIPAGAFNTAEFSSPVNSRHLLLAI